MKQAIYITRNSAGCAYRTRITFATVADEVYPPGGFLRVMRDSRGMILAGPHVDEIIEWDVKELS